MNITIRPIIPRFLSKVEIDHDTGCWLWTGTIIKPRGAAQFSIRGKLILAHRLMYEMAIGPIPDDYCVFRTCENQTCVNPDHLTIAPLKGNNYNARQTHCRNGHEYTPENTIIRKTGYRRCKACRAAEMAKQRRKQHATGLALRQCRHKDCYDWVQVEEFTREGQAHYRQWDGPGVPHKHHIHKRELREA